MSNTLIQVLAKFQTVIVDRLTESTTSIEILSNKSLGLTMPDGRYGFIVNEGLANQEFIIGTLTGNTLSELTRGVSPIDGKTSIPNLIKSHRKNSSIKITNHPALTQVVRALSGIDTLNPIQPIKYGTAPELLLPEELATVGYVLSVITTGNVNLGSLTIPGRALSVSEGDIVYLDESDGIWKKTDASDKEKSVGVKLGVARGTVDEIVAEPIPGGVLIQGLETQGTYTAGEIYYLSDTEGELSTTPGTNSVVFGIADFNENLLILEKLPEFINSATASETPAENAGKVPKLESNGKLSGEFLAINKKTVYITDSQTYTVPEGVFRIEVEIQGAGGDGGNSTSSTASNQATGGGSGGYAKKAYENLDETYQIVFSSGDIDFNSDMNVTKGSNGQSNIPNTDPIMAGGIGGTATGGDINVDGQRGHSAPQRLPGGDSFFGRCLFITSNGNGPDGQGYGSGGGGSRAAGTGGTGAPALCVIHEYYK
jgi:hypothetical protein